MPISVHVPIRLRLSGSRLETRLDDIEDAVSVTALRVLERSRVAALEPRSGYVRVSCTVPRFTWSGEVARASQPVREEIERRVAAALFRASERAALFDFQTTRDDAPEVLPDEVFEPFDPLRFDEGLGIYEIPSYDGKKPKKKSVRVKGHGKGSSPAETEQQPLTFGIVFEEFVDDNSEDFWNTFGWRVAEYLGEGRVPKVFGILYRIAGNAFPLLSIVEQSRGQVSRWLLYRFALALPPVEPKQPIPLTIADWGRFRWIRKEDPTKALEQWRVHYRKRLVKHYTESTVTKRGTEEEAKRAILDKAKKAVDDYTQGWETRYPQFYAFHYPGGVKNYPIGQALLPKMPPSGHAEVVPLAQKVEIFAEGEEGQGIGGDGKGAGGRYKLAPGQIPGFGDGVQGGIGSGIIAREYDARSPSRFPFSPSSDPLHPDRFRPVCEPYLREPTVFEMGTGGLEIWDLIKRIAPRLEMQPCPYAANFAINAAKVLGGRAAGVGDVVGMDKAVFLEDLSVGTIDKAGEIVFKPVPSPALQHLQELARIVPLLDELFEMIRKTLFPISAGLARGIFIEDFDKALESSIVWIYLYTCQIVLLQQLAASRDNILERLDEKKFEGYAQLTEVLLSEILADQLELVRLRDAIHRFKDKRVGLRLDAGDETRVFSTDPDFAPTWNAYYDLDNEMRVRPSLVTAEETIARHEKWVGLLRQLDEFRDRQDLYFRFYDVDHVVRSRSANPQRLGYIAKRADGQWAIADSQGNEWTLKELDAAVGIRQTFLENQDPILKHIKFRTDIPYLAKDKTRIRPFLKQLLKDMLDKNGEVRADALADPKWAFEHSKIDKPDAASALTSRPSYFGYQSGLHGMAHEVLADAFSGTRRYFLSINHLYDHQVGWVSLRDTFLFVGITFLSIFCPPLGAIAGLAEAIWRYGEAKDMETFYGALFDPQDIISRAEVEAQMFVAQLGLALSIIPVAGKITSTATRTIKAAAKQGIGTGLRAAMRRELDQLAEQMVQALGSGLVVELAQIPVMMKVMESILEPVVDDMIRQIEVSLPLAPKDEAPGQLQAYVDEEDDV